MYAKIVEISTLEGTPLTYVLLHIWSTKAAFKRGDPPDGDNDFLMDIHPTGERRIEDAQGRFKRIDGVFVHPDRAVGDEQWEMETFNTDIETQIKGNIETYLSRRIALQRARSPLPKFHADRAAKRSQDDPRGILVKSEVQALVGKEVAVK